MCGWEWIPYAVAAAAAAGGSYMSSEAANDAADRQAAALNAAMEGQDLLSRKAEGKALDNAEEYKMEDRTQRFEDTRQQAGESLVQSLIKSREEGGAPDQASGRLSESFSADRASKLADQFQKSVDNARLMGNMRGTQDMLGNEAIMNADYASQLNTIGRNARGSMDAARPGILSAGKVNTGQVALGSAISSLGTSYLGGQLGSMGGGDMTSSGAAAQYGTNAGSQQSGMLAAQESGMGTGTRMFGFGGR
jgi:hypothetical protein